MRTTKVILSCSCFLLSTGIFAQSPSKEDFRINEDSLKVLFTTILKSRSDDQKTILSQKIDSLFADILRIPASFNYSFDSLHNVGRLYSPDHDFRIINWNIPFQDGSFKYYGYIQTFNNKTMIYKSFRLSDRKDEITNPEDIILAPDKWYGALYYNIIKVIAGHTNYYTLLALQYSNANISRKVIEILYFDQTGTPVFGAPIFRVDNVVKKRIVFQYAAQVSMNLRYDKKLKMIVFDHLSPTEQKYTGEYEYYGPDLSFDGFEFKNDGWIFHSNLDLK